MRMVVGGFGAVLAAILLPLDLATANDCCPNGTVFLRQHKVCDRPDGSGMDFIPRNINCSEGMYLLDPKKERADEFMLLEDGHLQVGGNSSFFLAPPDKFCITRVQNDENSPVSTYDMAFICFPGDAEVGPGEIHSWTIIYGSLEAISTVFFFVTLAIYILVPELRDLQGRCIMSTVFCLLLGYLFLSGIQFKGHELVDTPCIVSAFFLYFWMLAAFFWLSVASFNVWRSVRYERFPVDDDQLFWCYCAVGWLSPAAFLIAALTTHHMPVTHDTLLRPNFGLTQCWFNGDTETWAFFYGPISMLLGCNISFFVMTALRLWRSGGKNNVPGIKASRFKCLLYLKLFIIMGILWIFEVISFLVGGKDGFWRIPDILNCLQGVFIFLVVACRKRVVQALAKRDWGRSVVAAVCPKWCLAGPDVEQEAATLASPVDDETYVPMDSAGRERT